MSVRDRISTHPELRGELYLVVITDLPTSPLAALDAVHLLVSEIDVGNFRVLAATMTLAMTLSVAVGARRRVV